jgi:hypothetical protein
MKDDEKEEIVNPLFNYVVKQLKSPFRKNISMIPFKNIFSLLEVYNLNRC